MLWTSKSLYGMAFDMGKGGDKLTDPQRMYVQLNTEKSHSDGDNVHLVTLGTPTTMNESRSRRNKVGLDVLDYGIVLQSRTRLESSKIASAVKSSGY
jgi:hypothetical protein